MKIAHLADIHIHCSNQYANKTAETQQILDTTAKSIIADNVDVVVIAGDVYTYYLTSEVERTLYADFIHQILQSLPKAHIVVVDGNHDIRKRNFKFFNGIAEANQVHVLEEFAKTIGNPRYHYSTDSKLLAIKDYPGIVFACWSELARYDVIYGAHSPYAGKDTAVIEKLKSEHFLIDVYHGTIAGSKGIGIQQEFKDDGAELKGHISMLGHIHMHQAIGNKVYASSLMQDSFDEGIRYARLENEGELQFTKVYDYSDQHGYCLWNIEPASKQAAFKFKPIFQPTLMVTIVIDNLTTKENLQSVFSKYKDRNVALKIVLDSPETSVLAYAYAYCTEHKEVTIVKVESIRNAEIAYFQGGEEVKSIELNYESFEAIARQICPAVIAGYQYKEADIQTRILEHTLKLLKQECGYHLHQENSDSIVMVSADIKNFKTIKHIHLDFAKNGLYALRGTNGHGKTSAFEAINFGVTGQHNETFKGNARKQQLSRLFNDKSMDNNVVTIDLQFLINGIETRVSTILERFLAEGYNENNWRSFVNRINRTIEIWQNGERIFAGDQADQWLISMFGSYGDFALLHSVNQATLDNLKYMSNTDVGNFILQRLGYSVLSKLEAFYGGCKSVELERFPKVSDKTIVELQLLLEHHRNSLSQAEQNIQSNAENLLVEQAKLSAKSAEIQNLQKTVQAVPTDLLANWNALLLPYIDPLTNQCKDLAALKAEAQAIVDAAKNGYEVSKAALSTYNTSKLALEEVQGRYDLAEKTLVNTVRTQFNEALQTAKETTVAAETAHTNAITANGNNATLRQRLTGELQIIQSKIDSYHSAIANAAEQIHKIETGVCPTCGQSLLNVNLDCKAQLELIKPQKAENERLLEAERSIYNAKDNELKAVPTALDLQALITSKTEAKAAEDVIQGKIDKLTDVDYKLLLMQSNNAALVQELASARAAIKAEDGNIDITKILEDYQAKQNVVVAIDKAIEAQSYIAKYAAIIDANKLIEKQIELKQSEYATINGEVLRLQGQIQPLAVSKTSAENNIAEVTKHIGQMFDYDIAQCALKCYGWLITKGLPQYLYMHTCSIVNGFIEELGLPTKIQPLLSTEEYGALMLRDRSELGTIIYRPIQDASGMELTIAGLAVCLAMHNANLTVNFPFAMLDELSGKLSTGTVEDPTNYLDVFLNVLKYAAKKTMITVVDHRLPDEVFDKVTKVIKLEDSNTSISDNL